MAVFGEVAGNPIDDHPDAVGVALIYEVHEVLGGAEAGSAGVVADDLVAPGSVVGMFSDGEHFDVGEAEFFDVGDEFGGEFSVGEETGTGFFVRDDDNRFGFAVRADRGYCGIPMHPGAEVEFVDGDGLGEGFALAALLHPVVVVPGVVAQVGDDRGGLWAGFLLEAVGVGFFVDVAFVVFDLIFVAIVFFKFWDEEFPDSSGASSHLVLATVPVVEVAKD